MECSVCGAEIKPGSKFCEKCGTPVPVQYGSDEFSDSDIYPEAYQQKKGRKKGFKVMVAFFIALALLMDGAMGYLIYTFTFGGGFYVANNANGRKYEGQGYYYGNDDWYICSNYAMMNSKAEVEYGTAKGDFLLVQTGDMAEGMIIDEAGDFYYVDNTVKPWKLPQQVNCGEMAYGGGYMFYVKYTAGYSEPEGTLYILDTKTKKEYLIENSIYGVTPMISPDGGTVAYTKRDGFNEYLCIAGIDKKKKHIYEEDYRPMAVANDGTVLCTSKDSTSIMRCSEDEHVNLYYGDGFTTYIINRDMNQILFSDGSSGYFIDGKVKEAKKLFDGEIEIVYSNTMYQSYGQLGGNVSDCAELCDNIYVTDDDRMYVINEDYSGAVEVPRRYSDLDGLAFNPETREMVYCCNGVLYKTTCKNGKAKESVLFKKQHVNAFEASYDLEDIWFFSQDALYYLSGKRAVLLDDEIDLSSDDDGVRYAWSIDDGRLYYVKKGYLYGVYASTKSLRTYNECDYLASVYGKIYYFSADDEAMYLNVDGVFQECEFK